MSQLHSASSDAVPFIRFGEGWLSIILPDDRMARFEEEGVLAVLLTTCQSDPDEFRPGTTYLCKASNVEEGVEVQVEGPYDEQWIKREEWICQSPFRNEFEVDETLNRWAFNKYNPLRMWILNRIP